MPDHRRLTRQAQSIILATSQQTTHPQQRRMTMQELNLAEVAAVGGGAQMDGIQMDGAIIHTPN
jgi:hypothetical protein